jgi:hypothetical protein
MILKNPSKLKTVKGFKVGSFFFDPNARMWELGHWRAATSSVENKTIDSNSETASLPISKQTISRKSLNKRAVQHLLPNLQVERKLK